ncbi:VMAP-C domain-containing protein [Streptomyces sp. NPDC000229]|uniref:VMAP-C domain-containing protein n=1 Tax=Streptomyces sp. NPDC000229 TaxID=3154247 RepID=UPI00332D6CC1
MAYAGQLTEQGRRCLVRVHGRTSGSGFLAAPSYVVTCAHVSGAAVGSPVTVHWGKAELDGRVVAASPAPTGGGLWPYPDLAIVKLSDAPTDHPCAWWYDRLPSGGSPLTAIGFSDKYRAVPEPLTSTFEYQGEQTLDGGRMLRLKRDEVTNGMSGGPVLDLSTGGVCAVVKATRSADSDMGGLATPIGALRLLEPSAYRALVRAHDSFHVRDLRWPFSSPHPPTPPWSAGIPMPAQRQLFAMLASAPAPAPDALSAGFHQASGRYAAAPELPLRAHRDVVSELESLVTPGHRAPRTLQYLAMVAREHAGELGSRLRTWVDLMGGVLGIDRGEWAGLWEPTPPPAILRSVMVRLRPSVVDRDRYHVAMWRYEGPDAISPVAAESAALPLEEALDLTRQRLPDQLALLGRSGGDRVMVELIVPQQLMEEDFDAWRLWPRRAWSSLGRKYPVVVRDLERFEDEELHPTWRERWDRFTAGAVAGQQALGLACNSHQADHEMLEGWMETDPDLAALVLAGSLRLAPSTTALEVALSCGVPVVMWRRTQRDSCAVPQAEKGGAAPHTRACLGCGEQGRCPTADTFAKLRRDLHDAPPGRWPEKVRRLRGEAASRAADEHHALNLVLLWDNPDRQLPDTPLHYAERGSARE